MNEFANKVIGNLSVQCPLYWGYKPFVVVLQAPCSGATSWLVLTLEDAWGSRFSYACLMSSNNNSSASSFIYTFLLFPFRVLHKIGVRFSVAFGYGIPYLVALEIFFNCLCVLGVVVVNIWFHVAFVAGFEVLHHALQASPPDKVHSSPAFGTEFT